MTSLGADPGTAFLLGKRMGDFSSNEPMTLCYALGSWKWVKFASFRFPRSLPVHLILGYTAQEQPIIKLFIKSMDLL